MIKTGLVSVSFRKLSPKRIIELVKEAGLDGIEWGGDVHVPHGDVEVAKQVYKMTNDAGIDVAAYGSYYYLGMAEERIKFEGVLESAIALCAPVIRVWAGNKGSAASGDIWREKVSGDARIIGAMAQRENIKIALEFHANTLTDTNDSAKRLLEEIGHENVYSYWQPPVDQTKQECIQGINMMAPWLSNIHTYYWKDKQRRPLSEGAPVWKEYFDQIKKIEGHRYSLMEFVKDDKEEQFLEDAKILKDLLG